MVEVSVENFFINSKVWSFSQNSCLSATINTIYYIHLEIAGDP